MARRNWNRVFVTGGTSFIGLRVIAALIDAGADVTVLVTEETEERLGSLRRHVHLVYGDVWNSASLKGRSRGHGVVVNLVGSIHAEPERGLTFQQLNLVSARNVIGMAVGDGVPYFVLLSAAGAPPGVSVEYLRNKREAEEYLRNSGLRYTIARAPIMFDRTQRGGAFFAALSRIGSLPVVRVAFGRRMPLPVDIAGRGLAQAALVEEPPRGQVLYAPDLRRLGYIPKAQRSRRAERARRRTPPVYEFESEDDIPFGWLPPVPDPSDDDSR